MADDVQSHTHSADDGGSSKRRRRRRRRRRPSSPSEGGSPQSQANSRDALDEVLVAEKGGKRRKGRRTVDLSGPSVSLPASGKNPFRKRSTRARRGSPSSAAGRR